MNQRRVHHPMAVVTRRTGLRADVIRAWERRHQAIRPLRTPGNRRLYSDEQIRRLILMRRALEAGWQISQVAPLDDAQIEALVEGHAVPSSSSTSFTSPTTGRDRDADIERHRSACMDAIERLDGERLRDQLEGAAVDLSRIDLLDRVLAPLMHEIGAGCASGKLRTAHEHLATAALRPTLDAMKGAYALGESAPRLVVTTPTHQHHELGALLVSATGRIEGWRTTYLGPNLPAEDIALATRQCRAQALALSLTFPDDDPDLGAELEKLGRILPAQTTILVGGQATRGYAEALEKIEARRLNSMAELRSVLKELR